MSGANSWPGASTPSVSITLPESAFVNQIESLGIRFGWMRAHTCPCAYARGLPGSPNPNCKTCGGRGIWWDKKPKDIKALLTYMHTASAPDEPGAITTQYGGHVISAEPTLTVAPVGELNETLCWTYASSFDAFVEYDARTRFNNTLVVSRSGQLASSNVLPYQFNVQIISVVIYDTVNELILPIPASDYNYANGVVNLVAKYEEGTAYTVEYIASPVMIAYRSAGGIPHARPFAVDETTLPRRFRLQTLDEWSRARVGGEAPQFGNGI